MATKVPRISPKEAHDHVEEGDAHLICAYEDEDKCRKLHLEGAMSLAAFRKQADSVSKESQLVFYCQ